jgi:voltage-gated potassium channel
MAMSWQRNWTRLAVLLTAVVAVLSLVTGVVNIGITAGGPFAELIPRAIRRTVGFTGAITGFLLLVAVFGLRRRLRAAWYLVVVLLPVTALQGLLQSRAYSLPLVVLSLVAFVVIARTRVRFEREMSLTTTQLGSLAAIIGALVYGTVGTYALREGFTGVASPLDALYYTLVTASTVGYGDVTATAPQARLFSLSVVLLGTASFGLAVGSVLGPAIEARFTHALGTMTESQLSQLEDHVLVLGYGDLTEPILGEIATHADFVAIVRDMEQTDELAQHDYKLLTADPSDAEPLQRAGIERARAVVVATENDAEDALAILTARQLNPEIRIVAAATERENIPKLRNAGADTVVSPATIGGHLLVQSAFGDISVEEVADRIRDDILEGET